MKAGSGYAHPIADGQLQHLAPVTNPAVPSISERAKEKELMARRLIVRVHTEIEGPTCKCTHTSQYGGLLAGGPQGDAGACTTGTILAIQWAGLLTLAPLAALMCASLGLFLGAAIDPRLAMALFAVLSTPLMWLGCAGRPPACSPAASSADDGGLGNPHN